MRINLRCDKYKHKECAIWCLHREKHEERSSCDIKCMFIKDYIKCVPIKTHSFRFKKTKAGLAICPFFTWISEHIESQEDTECNVSLIHCTHESNVDFEGNCNEKDCPLIKGELSWVK